MGSVLTMGGRGICPRKVGLPDPLVHPGCTQRGSPLWHRARAQYHGSDCACAGNRCRAANLTEARISQELSYSCPCKGGGGWGVTSLERGNLAARGKSPPEGCPATPVRARRFEDEGPKPQRGKPHRKRSWRAPLVATARPSGVPSVLEVEDTATGFGGRGEILCITSAGYALVREPIYYPHSLNALL